MTSQPIYIAWRFYLIVLLITLTVAGLAWRILDLAILNQHFLQKQGDNRVLRLISTPSFRGMIVDRNGFPLAVSTPVYSAWMNPLEFEPGKSDVASLASLLAMKQKEILSIYKKKE